jgi:ribosome-binding factor A
MTSLRQEKMNEEVRKYVSEALNTIATHQSLITVTRADIAPNFKNGKIYVSILPESQERAALAFIERHAHDIREYLKKHLATRVVPFLTFELDLGERNRQRIEELINEDESLA